MDLEFIKEQENKIAYIQSRLKGYKKYFAIYKKIENESYPCVFDIEAFASELDSYLAQTKLNMAIASGFLMAHSHNHNKEILADSEEIVFNALIKHFNKKVFF